MRLIRAIGLLLLSFALIIGSAACATTETIDISAYCIGDSITFGLGCESGGYEATLQTLLKTRANENWTIYNLGVCGDTTSGMLARFSTDVLSHPDCKYVFIWGGINDVQLGYDVLVPEANLQSMFTQAHTAGIIVVSLNLIPLNYMWTPTKRAAIKAINAWIAETATDVDYRIDVYSVFEDPDDPGHLNSAYTTDGLHLNCSGYNLVAKVVFQGVMWP